MPIKIVDQFFSGSVSYEQMGELYRQKTGKELDLMVEAYGFEMPGKLGTVMRTGEEHRIWFS